MSSGAMADPRHDREQREHPRREVRLAVTVRDAEGAAPGVGELIFDTRDLSSGGAFLRSELFFEIGEELEIELVIPDGPMIVALARVVHVLAEAAPGGGAPDRSGPPPPVPGMGIAFTQLGARDREALEAFVARDV